MKALIYLMVLVVSAAAGYLIHPALYQIAENSRPKPDPTLAANTGGSSSANGSTKAAPTALEQEAKRMGDKLKGVGPPPSADPAAGTPTVAEVEDEFAKKFPLPKFKAIEEITKDWTYIPAKVFPRPVKSKVEIEFHITGGKSTVPKGSEIFAVGMTEGQLIVSRDREGTLKETVPLEGVDLKDTMIDLYEKYKKRLTDRVIAAREKAKYERDHPAPPPPPEDERVKLAGPKPTPDGEGKIPEMVASIQAKDVTEFKENNILAWKPVDFQMEGQNGYWTCNLDVRMSTLFGDVDTEVSAYISKGKVVKWIYAGSKEPVQ